jgi:hypothetical protein
MGGLPAEISIAASMSQTNHANYKPSKPSLNKSLGNPPSSSPSTTSQLILHGLNIALVHLPIFFALFAAAWIAAVASRTPTTQ